MTREELLKELSALRKEERRLTKAMKAMYPIDCRVRIRRRKADAKDAYGTVVGYSGRDLLFVNVDSTSSGSKCFTVWDIELVEEQEA